MQIQAENLPTTTVTTEQCWFVASGRFGLLTLSKLLQKVSSGSFSLAVDVVLSPHHITTLETKFLQNSSISSYEQ